ncbi:MAG TPA: hypothetical protein VM600_10450, partial [Actinomycetota bacterium]|nr:hypothetical protein [Actinomycetota bacterium]
MSERILRRGLCLALVSTVFITSSIGGLPAAHAAPDQPTQDVTQGIDDWFAFVGKLASVGALGQPIPGLSLIPGGEHGLALADFYVKWRANKLTNWSGVDTLDELVSRIQGAAGNIGDTTSRTVSDITASRSKVGTLNTIPIAFKLNRTVDVGLRISDTSPQFTFSSPNGVSVVLSLQVSFTVLYDEATNAFSIKHTSTSPQLSLSATGTIPTPASARAAVGILGVQLGSATTFSMTAGVVGSISDPDGDGRLAFALPGGGAGELAAEDAAQGLGSFVITPSSQLSGSLQIAAEPTTKIANLPTFATATVSISSPNLATQPVEVSFAAGALDPIEAFNTMSPSDLASSLSQLAASLRAAMRSKDAALPFMRGNISEAIFAEEAIIKFLEKHVTEIPDDITGNPSLAGTLDFSSVQDLVALLEAETGLPGGADISVTGGSYDTIVSSKPKLRLTINIERLGGSTPVALDPAADTLAGSGSTVTYGNTTITDSSKTFSNAVVADRQINAGTSSAIIKRVKPGDPNTLELSPTPFGATPPAVLWKNGKPAAGTPYSIAGLDPRTGQVEFGDALAAKTGIQAANANAPLATVKPSYNVSLPLVLNLEPANFSDCDPGAGTATCPNKVTSPDGTATIVSSTPTIAQRIMVHTGTQILTADAPIETTVDLSAVVGFLGVKVTGTLRACTKGAPANCVGSPPSGAHLLSLTLKERGDSQKDLPIAELFDKLRTDLSNTLTTSIKGQAYADLALSVPGESTFFPGGSAALRVTMADVTDPTNVSFDADYPSLKAFNFDPTNPTALFGALLANFQTIAGIVQRLGGGGALETKIPLIGRSVSDLVGSFEQGGGSDVSYGAATLTDDGKTFDQSYVGKRVVVGGQVGIVTAFTTHTLTVEPAWATEPEDDTPYVIGDELTAAIDALQAKPSDSLQEMLGVLEQKMGAGSAVKFTVDPATSPPTLRLTIDWARAYKSDFPLDLDFQLPGSSENRSLAGAAGSGTLRVDVGGRVKLSVLVPMSAAAIASPGTNLKVDPTQSFIETRAQVDGTNLAMAVNLGPLALSLGNPSADPTGSELKADVGIKVQDTTDTTPVTLDTFAGNLTATLQNGTVVCPGAPGHTTVPFCS